MKRGYNELVGLRVECSRVAPRYSLTHHYRWRVNGKQGKTGILRGYSMCRHIPITEVLRSVSDAYASAILSIWLQITDACYASYFQFEVGATPEEMNLEGEWRPWLSW